MEKKKTFYWGMVLGAPKLLVLNIVECFCQIVNRQSGFLLGFLKYFCRPDPKRPSKSFALPHPPQT